MLRGFSLRDFGASLNTAESYTNESSQGKIGLYETVSKQKCTHLGMFLASDLVKVSTKHGNALATCLCDSFVVDTTDKEKQKLFSMLLEQMSQQLMSLVSLHMMNGSD